MPSSGTPNEGRDRIISDRVYTSGTLDLRLYVNLQDSLSDLTVFGDLVEPTGTGYAPILLTGVFSELNGVVTYDSNPIFENTEPEGGSNWSNPITGVVMTDGTYILHFQDLITSPVTMSPGYKIEVDLSTLIAP